MDPSTEGVASLNDAHQEELRKFLRFSRFKREQHVKEVTGAVEDMKEVYLSEETFTQSEVEQILDAMTDLVKDSVETELENMSQVSAALLQQVFQQAQRRHLTLKADTESIENQDLLNDLATFETKKATEAPGSAAIGKLPSMAATADKAALLLEIDQLKAEQANLRAAAERSQQQCTEVLREKSARTAELNMARDDLATAQTALKEAQSKVQELSTENATMASKLGDLGDDVGALRSDAAKAQAASSQLASTSGDLAGAQARIKELEHELKATKAELDAKLNQTAQFAQLRKMLATKNDQLKELRAKLAASEA